MWRAVEEAKLVFDQNAKHRKGWLAQDTSLAHVILHTIGEMTELYEAIVKIPPESNEEQKFELADVLAGLAMVMVRMGWDAGEIDRKAVEKFRKRWAYVMSDGQPTELLRDSLTCGIVQPTESGMNMFTCRRKKGHEGECY